MSLTSKGRLAPVVDADLVMFDADRVAPVPPEWRNDLPDQKPWLIERAQGIEYTIVGGRILLAHDEYQGGLLGK